ncbi:hypothetical protein V6H11_005645, partial [Burkholderia multivorans]|nr:hypothetical protein [Burkholderia multivorans]
TTPSGGGTVSAGLSGSSNGGAAAGGTGNLLSPVTNLLGGLLGGTKK